MTSLHYGDVVWMDFDPSSGHEQIKRRPAVIVSNDAYNRYNNLVMVVPITSDHEYPLHINIGIVPTEHGEHIHGWAQVEQLKSIDLESRNATRIGELDEDTLDTLTSMVLGCLMQPGMRIQRTW